MNKDEVARKIQNLINSKPQSPRLEEIRDLLPDQPSLKDGIQIINLDYGANLLVGAYGIINVIDELCHSSTVKLLDHQVVSTSPVTWRTTLQRFVDDLHNYAVANNIKMTARKRNTPLVSP